MRTKNNRNPKADDKELKKSVLNNSIKVIAICSFLSITPTSSAAVGADIASMLTTATANAIALIKSEVAEAAENIAHMTQSIGTFSFNTVNNINNNMNTMLGSIKVATAQNAQSAQALAEVQTQASQKLATARQTIHMQDQLLKAMRKYGGNAQGFKACVTVSENKGLDSANEQAKITAALKETETLSATTLKTNLNANTYDRLKLSETEFCAAGNPSCKPSSLPGGNVNGALLFTATEEGTKEHLARTMFRENVVGLNMQGLNSTHQISSPSGQASYYQSNRMSALLSPAAYSLAYIDAQNTKTVERDGKKYSPNELIDKTVSRYYGGEESKEWQASMIAQEPRGLLVEAARLKGLSVWLSNHTYQQNLRKEANLASILLATSTPLTEEVRDLGNKAEARAIRSALPLYD